MNERDDYRAPGGQQNIAHSVGNGVTEHWKLALCFVLNRAERCCRRTGARARSDPRACTNANAGSSSAVRARQACAYPG